MLCILFCSCSTTEIDKELIGTWAGDTNPQRYVFKSNGRYEHYINDELRDKGSFSTSTGYNYKSITFKSSNGKEITYNYHFNIGFLFIDGYYFRRIK